MVRVKAGSADLFATRASAGPRAGAEAAGVRLAIEPLRPMFCADRSVIVSLRQALDVAERFPADAVGVL